MTGTPFTPSRESLRKRLRAAHLYLLVTESVAAMPWIVAAEDALRGGVDVVQLREKDLDDEEFARRAAVLQAVCTAHRRLFVVNDRVEIARAVGADGVHLGQGDTSVAEARAILGPDAVIGISTHDADELQRALADGCDYVGVGSVFPTTTKGSPVKVGSPAELAPLAAQAEDAGVPAFAIGGIDGSSVADVASAGFQRIAVCSGVLAAADPAAAARSLRATVTPPA